MTKRELVILLKPTIVHADSDWSEDIEKSRDRMRQMDPPKKYNKQVQK